MNVPEELRALLHAGDARRLFHDAGVAVESVAPDYVKHKPGETTIVGYLLTTAAGTIERGYAHWCASSERAGQVHDKALTFRPRRSALGVETCRLDEHTIFYPFPNDARLRRLRWFTSPRKLKRTLPHIAPPGDRISGALSRVDVLRYKPERRVVADATIAGRGGEQRRVVIRYTTAPGARRLASTARQLHAHGTSVPRPITQLERDQVSVDEFVAGQQLRDVISAADGSVLALALHRFHSTPPARLLGERTPTADLDRARRGLAALTVWHPDLGSVAREIETLLGRVVPDAPRTSVFLHGDLHGENLLVDGDAIAFVDLERAAVGPAAIDLGCLRAHAIAQPFRLPGGSQVAIDHADAAIDRYRSIGRAVGDTDVAWHTATGLVDQALLVTRQLEAEWDSTSVELLDAARSELARAMRSPRGVTR